MRRKLLFRLTVTLLAVLVLYGLILGLPAMAWQSFAAKRAFKELILASMLAGERRKCESSPADFVFTSPSGGHYYPYGPDGSPSNPKAPALPKRLLAQLDRIRGVALDMGLFEPDKGGRMAAARMPWKGPCSIIGGKLPLESAMVARTVLTATIFWALVCALLALGAGLLVYSPMVKRIRKLERAAASIADGNYSGRLTLQGHDELADLARSFNKAADEITKRDMAMTKLLQDVSHDLVTPLASLQAAVEAISRADNRKSEKFEDNISRALEEVTYMAGLVRDLKAASKSDAGNWEPQIRSLDLNEIVKRVVNRFIPLARRRGISLDYSVPDESIIVDADDSLVQQTLSNIVQNSVQYNHDGGHIAVVLQHDKEADAFRLEITDDGPGVGKEQIPHLTQRLFRGDQARARRPGGMGLGLSIAEKVTASHGWKLEFFQIEPSGLGVAISGDTRKP
ncbi:MAG: HAMP domain-containing histidine kinase [Deltaproteobacteria bacterium]|nr:HAMP domain-containing histidine kinase [Deltaproteobacteria bacterium]